VFALEPHPSPVTVDDRSARLVDPVFGRVFTDHMAVMLYNEEQGWHDGRITARAPLTMDPASAVLHYAQEIFEGMKAYRQQDDSVALFRPRANAERFRSSARRMAMPELPDDLFLASIHALVNTDRDWIPDSAEGSLYLRPFMIASEVFLGVKPAAQYTYMVLASSVGAYWKGGARAVSLWVSHEYTRAAPGGTGATRLVA
jgi:branched-chain amino acid aminotransferase